MLNLVSFYLFFVFPVSTSPCFSCFKNMHRHRLKDVYTFTLHLHSEQFGFFFLLCRKKHAYGFCKRRYLFMHLTLKASSSLFSISSKFNSSLHKSPLFFFLQFVLQMYLFAEICKLYIGIYIYVGVHKFPKR